jgi:hypothetical protein
MWSIQEKIKMLEGQEDILSLDEISLLQRNFQILFHDLENDTGNGLQLQILVE